MFTEEFLAPFLTLFGEHDRFGLAHRIEDHSLLVQPIHRTPVVSFPCTSIVMDGQEEKCEYHLVDFIFVVFHKTMLPFRSQSFNRCSKMKSPNKWLRAIPTNYIGTFSGFDGMQPAGHELRKFSRASAFGIQLRGHAGWSRPPSVPQCGTTEDRRA